jgi:hypothetical protein
MGYRARLPADETSRRALLTGLANAVTALARGGRVTAMEGMNQRRSLLALERSTSQIGITLSNVAHGQEWRWPSLPR